MNNRDRGDAVVGAAPAQIAETKFWQGTNFWVALSILIGSLWGLGHEDVSPVITSVFGLIGGLFLVREKVKSASVNVLAWISSPNTWNYAVAVLGYVIPNLPAGLGEKISDIIAAIASKNWPNVISAVLSFVAIIYFWVTGGKGLKALRTA